MATKTSSRAIGSARTTPRKSATRKPATDTAGTAMPDSIGPTPEPEMAVVIELPLPEDGGTTMKKKELVDLVVARSGLRKRDVKPAIEAALAILGEALAEGRELNLQPLGKLKVTRMKKGGNGQIINARVRQPEDSTPPATAVENTGAEPLAPAAE